MKEPKGRGMMLDPNKAVFTVAELCRVLQVAADFSLTIASLIEEGKYEEARASASGMGHGLPQSLVKILAENSLRPEDLPPEVQAKINEEIMDLQAEAAESPSPVKVSMVEMNSSKRTYH